MKLTNLEILTCYENLNKFINDAQDTKLPVKLSYAITRNFKKINELAETIGEVRTEIIKKYSDIDEDNDKYVVRKECLDIFDKEVKELQKIENEVDLFMIDLSEIENYDISLINILRIDFMIK